MKHFKKASTVDYVCKRCDEVADQRCTQCHKPVCENCDEYAVDAESCYFHRACWPELFERRRRN